MPSPYLKGWVYIPHALAGDLNLLRRRLTTTPRQMSRDRIPNPISVYDENVPGYFGVPIDFGFSFLPEDVPIVDLTSRGHPITCPKVIDPFHPSAPAGQDVFMDDLEHICRNNHTVLAKGDTGTGKTAVALEVARRMGRTTIVCVHIHRLLDQWVKQCKDLLGLEEHEIGTVVGQKCDYKGKKIVIAMMPSLAGNIYEDEFYDYFGFAIWDEVHKVGTDLLSQTVGQFNSAVKLAMSATLERKDEADRLYKLYFGECKVVAEMVPVPIAIHTMDYMTESEVWGSDRNQKIMCISRDFRRNSMLAARIKKKFDSGAHVLGIGDSIQQIEWIRGLLMKRGVKDKQIGQYTNEYIDPDNKKKRLKFKKAHYDWCRDHPRILLGTYGTMREGVDIPRLSVGFDLTPRAEWKQVLGRVRRIFPGKELAEWHTTKDLAIAQFVAYYKSRMREVENDPSIRIIERQAA